MIEPILWYWAFACGEEWNRLESKKEKSGDPYETPDPFDEPEEDEDYDSDWEE